MIKWSMVVKAQVGWQQFLTSARSSGGRNEDEKDKGLGEPKRCGKGEKKDKENDKTIVAFLVRFHKYCLLSIC